MDGCLASKRHVIGFDAKLPLDVDDGSQVPNSYENGCGNGTSHHSIRGNENHADDYADDSGSSHNISERHLMSGHVE